MEKKLEREKNMGSEDIQKEITTRDLEKWDREADVVIAGYGGAGAAAAVRRAQWREAAQACRAAARTSALKLLGQPWGVSLFAARLEVSVPDAVSYAEVLAEIVQIVRAAEEMPDDNEPIH